MGRRVGGREEWLSPTVLPFHIHGRSLRAHELSPGGLRSNLEPAKACDTKFSSDTMSG